jgi:glycosyltransferase involved in cell wall biosynthesis
MKLVATICMHNEVIKGNLERCLQNLDQYCDEIVIWDDGSTDNSVEVASRYTNHIFSNGLNDQMNELQHKQFMLDRAIELGATHIFWLDCDEIVECKGIQLMRWACENWPDGLDAYSFLELNLWRSQRWIRTDSLFAVSRFVRLWKVTPNITFKVERGVHKRLYPSTIKNIKEAPFGVIHYGFWDYPKMLVKIGAHLWTRQDWLDKAVDNWILNETQCSCYYAEDGLFPLENIPTEDWPQPQPKIIAELRTYNEIIGEQ